MITVVYVDLLCLMTCDLFVVLVYWLLITVMWDYLLLTTDSMDCSRWRCCCCCWCCCYCRYGCCWCCGEWKAKSNEGDTAWSSPLYLFRHNTSSPFIQSLLCSTSPSSLQVIGVCSFCSCFCRAAVVVVVIVVAVVAVADERQSPTDMKT